MFIEGNIKTTAWHGI